MRPIDYIAYLTVVLVIIYFTVVLASAYGVF